MSFKIRWSVLAALITAIGSAGLAAEPIDTAQFEKLHALIKPPESEAFWTTLPWLTSLWEARQQAAAEGKPILLWEMDGHPLGCT
ncbi:MAG: hypothetical protein HYS13_16270 [Planctomycetia bacterium]|nr:hypothetical protein [Planctomycetia bacterium]